MSTTANIDITYVVASQTQKEVTVNAGFDTIDGAIAGVLSTDCTGSVDVTPTAQNVRQARILKLTGALGADINFILPVCTKDWIVINSTTGGHSTTVKTASGTGVATVAGNTKLVFCDGTNIVDIV